MKLTDKQLKPILDKAGNFSYGLMTRNYKREKDALLIAQDEYTSSYYKSACEFAKTAKKAAYRIQSRRKNVVLIPKEGNNWKIFLRNIR